MTAVGTRRTGLQKFARFNRKFTVCFSVDERGTGRAKIDWERRNGYGQWNQEWEGAADLEDIKGRR